MVLRLADLGQGLCLSERPVLLYLLQTLHEVIVPAVIDRYVLLRGLLHSQASHQLELVVYRVC